MRDIGFTPQRGDGMMRGMRRISGASIQYGWRVPAVKWALPFVYLSRRQNDPADYAVGTPAAVEPTEVVPAPKAG